MTEIYFGDVLGSYANGVQLDLRVKLAVDFLKAMGNGLADQSPKETAAFALDLATELLSLAEERKLLAPMPESDDLSAPMRRHIRRQVRAQIVGQVAGQQIAADEAPKLAIGPGGINGLARQ